MVRNPLIKCSDNSELAVSKREFSERFEREARAISALNHPHICQLYHVGPNYLVLEFAEGECLKRLLRVDKALEYSREILDALDHAHCQHGSAYRGDSAALLLELATTIEARKPNCPNNLVP